MRNMSYNIAKSKYWKEWKTDFCILERLAVVYFQIISGSISKEFSNKSNGVGG